MLATGGGGGHLKKFSGHIKNCSGDIIFFPEYEKKVPGITQFYPNITTFFRTYQNTKTNAIINQRPLGKKCNLNDIFHGGKGHFAPGKRALLKTWALCPRVPTPLKVQT
jgi:hypothetical protein